METREYFAQVDGAYGALSGPDLERDYSSPLLESVLQESLLRINRGLPAGAITEALAKLKDLGSGSLLQKNMPGKGPNCQT